MAGGDSRRRRSSVRSGPFECSIWPDPPTLKPGLLVCQPCAASPTPGAGHVIGQFPCKDCKGRVRPSILVAISGKKQCLQPGLLQYSRSSRNETPPPRTLREKKEGGRCRASGSVASAGVSFSRMGMGSAASPGRKCLVEPSGTAVSDRDHGVLHLCQYPYTSKPPAPAGYGAAEAADCHLVAGPTS